MCMHVHALTLHVHMHTPTVGADTSYLGNEGEKQAKNILLIQLIGHVNDANQQC